MDDLILERYELSKERIREITEEQQVPEPYGTYFRRTAAFLAMTAKAFEEDRGGWDLEQYREENTRLYEDILPEHYAASYGNPSYAVKMLGDHGQLLSFLYAELRGTIVYAF